MTRSAPAKEPAVPKAMAAHYQALVALTDDFSARHLNPGYAELARRAAAGLCRKRQSPVVSGKKETWACAIIYALGQVNFLSDKASTPCMSMQEVCTGFGVGASTGGNKAKTVRDALGIKMFDHRWMLPERLADNPGVWMVQYKGLPTDLHHLPRPLQVDAFTRGIVPYVPADGPGGDGSTREPLLARYDHCRAVTKLLQSRLVETAWPASVAPVALRLGQIRTEAGMATADRFDLVESIDLALYAPAADGTTLIGRLAADMAPDLPDFERQILDTLCTAEWSFYRIEGCHRGAGVDLTNMISGETIWMMDRTLEASAFTGTVLATRLFKPEDFWISTGVAAQMDDEFWRGLESALPLRRQSVHGLKLGRNIIAEALYKQVEN